jgi:hypothetical protein
MAPGKRTIAQDLVQRKRAQPTGGTATAAEDNGTTTTSATTIEPSISGGLGEGWEVMPGPSVQMKAGAEVVQQRAGVELSGGEVGAIAEHGVGGALGRLPFADVIADSFGRHDVSGVRVAIGGGAAEASAALGASAYATGDTIGFARDPDLHLAAHEAAHVVQQRQGVHLSGGVGAAGDVYEQHADAVADAVVRGESAEALLDRHAGGGAGSVQRGVQRRELSPDVTRTMDMCGQMQERLERLRERHPNADDPHRVAMEELGAERLFDELTALVARLERTGEVTLEITVRLLQINDLIGRMEQPAPRARQAPAPASRRPGGDSSRADAVSARPGHYPDYFGPASTEAMRRIENMQSNWAWVGNLTLGLAVLSIAMSQNGTTPREIVSNHALLAVTGTEGILSIPGGAALDVSTQAEAALAANVVAARGIVDIAQHMVIEDDLNAQEQRFWANLLQNAERALSSRRRGGH